MGGAIFGMCAARIARPARELPEGVAGEQGGAARPMAGYLERYVGPGGA